MQKVLVGATAIALGFVTLTAHANDGGIDDFYREKPKKSGAFTVDRCYVIPDYMIKYKRYLPDEDDPNFCDRKSSGAILNAAFNKKANFNKNYVLYEHQYSLSSGLDAITWFAVDKRNKKVAIIPVEISPYHQLTKERKSHTLNYSLSSNKLCVKPLHFKIKEPDPTFDLFYETDQNGNVCFWLKSDKNGPYWSEWP